MISSSPRSLPIDSGDRRCQHASARATARPFVVRYMTIGLPAIVLASRLGPTSWSHAAAYQGLRGKWRKVACPVCEADGDDIGVDILSSGRQPGPPVGRGSGAERV